MSYCEIIPFRNGKPEPGLECRNAWGGAAYIWSALFDRFLKDPNIEHDTWLVGDGKKLWTLHKRMEIPRFMRAVHMSTYDMAVVMQKDLPQFAQDLREFVSVFGTNDRACHLLTWAEFVEAHLDVEAIGFHATSVTENLWRPWNEMLEENVPYDLHKGDQHLDVYAELTQLGGA